MTQRYDLFEARDDPDDLPLVCDTERAAWSRAARRADRIGGPVLVYGIREHCSPFGAPGEYYLGCV